MGEICVEVPHKKAARNMAHTNNTASHNALFMQCVHLYGMLNVFLSCSEICVSEADSVMCNTVEYFNTK